MEAEPIKTLVVGDMHLLPKTLRYYAILETQHRIHASFLIDDSSGVTRRTLGEEMRNIHYARDSRAAACSPGLSPGCVQEVAEEPAGFAGGVHVTSSSAAPDDGVVGQNAANSCWSRVAASCTILTRKPKTPHMSRLAEVVPCERVANRQRHCIQRNLHAAAVGQDMPATAHFAAQLSSGDPSARVGA